jgi:sulfide dehydrogenase cytochrome subunit
MPIRSSAIPIIMISLIGLSSVSLAVAEPVSQGAVLSASCAGCHGTDGRSPGSIPPINGRSEEFIRASLEDFRSGRRPSTVMGRHAKGYTDEEIVLIAEYFATRQETGGD